MKRSAYIGDSGVQSSGNPSIPMQAETQAYLGRFSTAPSDTFRNALNQAIYRWKQAGVWSLVQDLWLLCGGTQADSLRNLITAARDATISGAPTFTAHGGFSGLGASNYVSLPFSSTGVTMNSGFIWAGRFEPSVNLSQTLMGNGTGAGSVVQYPYSSANAHSQGVSFASTNRPTCQSPSIAGGINAVIGAVGPTGVLATAAVSATGGGVPPTPSPILANSANQNRLTAYGVLPSASAGQLRPFLSILQSFLEDIGALA